MMTVKVEWNAMYLHNSCGVIGKNDVFQLSTNATSAVTNFGLIIAT
jgi:hypothetical protein